MPSMTCTQLLRDAVEQVMAMDLPSAEKELLQRHGAKADSYPMEVVELVRRRLPAPQPYLFELLAGSSVALPPPPAPRPRNPENEARLKVIRAQLEEREYSEMVKDVRREEIEAAEPGAFQSYKSQLGEGMSIIFSKATAFGIGYYMSRTVHGVDPVHNSICGLVGLILGLMIDGTLLIIRSSYRDGDAPSISKGTTKPPKKMKAKQK